MNTSANPYYEISVIFPPIHYFNRPFWAYRELKGGWRLLRRLLFGDTYLLTKVLTEEGSIILSQRRMEQLFMRFNIHPTVRFVLLQNRTVKTSTELAQWYQEWEDSQFDAYCEREQRRVMRDLGYRSLDA